MKARASTRHQAIFVLLTLLLSLGAAELAARIGLRLIDGTWGDAAAWAGERAAASADPSQATPAGRATHDPTTVASANPAPGIVIHPFFGFVRDPAVHNRWWDITPEGFFTRRPPLTEPHSPQRLRIAVVGGSVANHFAFGGWPALGRVLGQATGLSRFAVRVTSLAMGGYKQPQQLTILAHHLARGEHFDIIINLDGFNDVVLPFDNLRAGLAPDYPVHWAQRVQSLGDLARQQRAGELAYLGRLRGERAGLCPGIMGSSALCQLVWRLRDQPLALRQARLRSEMARPAKVADRAFEIYGPAPKPLETSERYAGLVDYWRNCSLEIDAIARVHHSRYYHFLQPNQYLPGSKPLSAEELRSAYDPGKGHRPIIEAAYPLLQQAGLRLSERGVRFYDLTQVFASVRETLYQDDCCHLNVRGNELLGEAIGRVIAADLASEPVAGTARHEAPQ